MGTIFAATNGDGRGVSVTSRGNSCHYCCCMLSLFFHAPFMSRRRGATFQGSRIKKGSCQQKKCGLPPVTGYSYNNNKSSAENTCIPTQKVTTVLRITTDLRPNITSPVAIGRITLRSKGWALFIFQWLASLVGLRRPCRGLCRYPGSVWRARSGPGRIGPHRGQGRRGIWRDNRRHGREITKTNISPFVLL